MVVPSKDKIINVLSCVSAFVNSWLTGLCWVGSVFQVFLGVTVQSGQNMVKTIQCHILFPKVSPCCVTPDSKWTWETVWLDANEKVERT